MIPTVAQRRFLPRKRAVFAVVLLVLHAVLYVTPAMARTPPPEVTDEMQARVKAIFDRVAQAVPPENDVANTYTIQVVAEQVPNAWINRDHEIYVSSGLMELLRTDDQLAGVIGHEIAHGTQGHIPHRIHQSLWSAFAVVALGTIAGSSGQADWGGLLHMRDLFLYAYNREQESEADLVGMGYARAAGYNPEGLVEALQLMDGERRRLPSESIWQQLYRTHPPISQRVSDLRFILATEKLERVPLRSSALTSRQAAPKTAEAGADAWAKAVWAGEREAMTRLALPGKEDDVLARFDALPRGVAQLVAPSWADADVELASFQEQMNGNFAPTFDTTFIVRLRRLNESGSADSSPPLAVSLRRTAKGWFVTSWELVETNKINTYTYDAYTNERR